ncbi:hypothetical protein AB0D49_34280 [Streptomyces sp. NPDC048290]|uniref:hypothetical protein n=1 Tax=Streptomyces sp. NPDC048290 TaxID=3155811 RepID=UPI003426CC9A
MARRSESPQSGSDGSDASNASSYHSAYMVQDRSTGERRITDTEIEPVPVPESAPELPQNTEGVFLASGPEATTGTYFSVNHAKEKVKCWSDATQSWVRENRKFMRDLLLDFTPNAFSSFATAFPEQEMPLQVAAGVTGAGVAVRDGIRGYQHYQQTGEVFTMNNTAALSRMSAAVFNATSAGIKESHPLASRATGALGTAASAFAGGLDVAQENQERKKGKQKEDVGNERGGELDQGSEGRGDTTAFSTNAGQHRPRVPQTQSSSQRGGETSEQGSSRGSKKGKESSRSGTDKKYERRKDNSGGKKRSA